MAIKFLQNIDLGQNQLLHARVHVATSAPAGSGKGSIWLNSSTNELNFHNGTGFVSVMDDTNTNQLTTFTLTADSGTNQTVGQGETLDIAGGASITTSVGNTNTVTIDVTDNTIGAAELDVSGNGATTQFLKSDGNGSFSWAVPVDTNTDTNTQNVFTTSFVDSASDALLRLTKSGAASGTQDIKFVAGDNITLTPTDASNLTITATDTNTFRTVTAGGNTLGGSETLAFTAGSNVTITEIGGAVTIASTDTNTTYSVGDGGLTQNNFTNADHTKLDGIEPSADVTDTANVKTALNASMGGAATIGDGSDTITIPGSLVVTGTTKTNNVETVSTSNGVIFEGNAADDNEGTLLAGTLSADRTYTLPNKSGTVAMTSDITGTNSGTNTGDQLVFKTIAVSGQTNVDADSTTDTLTLAAAGGMTITTSGDTITLSSANTNTQLSTEQVQDIVGGMFSGNTETRVSATYQDGDGTIDLVVDDMTANTTYSAGNGLALSGTTFSVDKFEGALAAVTSGITKSQNTYTITHGLGNNRVNVVVTTTADPYEQVFPEINYASAAGDGTVLVIFGQSVSDSDYNVTITR
jgi:hypothetical protein